MFPSRRSFLAKAGVGIAGLAFSALSAEGAAAERAPAAIDPAEPLRPQPRTTPIWLAGGGVRPGQSIGQTDAIGLRAEVQPCVEKKPAPHRPSSPCPRP